MESWDDSIYYMEQPVYNPSMAMYCYTNKILSENKIVVTMAGDMGDELLGGYPKYWKLTKPEEKINSWQDLVWKWMHRIKRPVEMTRKISKQELHKILCEQLPQEVWNPSDHVNSYMALDCVTQVPEDFFARNDKGYMPDYILNKQKTGWTVPLMYWLNDNKKLQSFMAQYMNKNDCLKNVISQQNQVNKKPRLISWMMRSWAQSYDMTI